MSRHFDAQAYRAAREKPRLTLNSGEVLEGRLLSFNEAVDLAAQMEDGGVQGIREALRRFGFDPERVLSDLDAEEVGEALNLFFGFQKRSPEASA